MSMSSFFVILVVLFWWTYFLFLFILAFPLQLAWLFFYFLFDYQLVQIIPAPKYPKQTAEVLPWSQWALRSAPL